MKTLIPVILIIMLYGCATVQQSPHDLRDRMNRVHIGMTHQEVENLIGKPTSATTHDTASGRMEICDYTFGTVDSTTAVKTFIAGIDNDNKDLSMVVVYNDGVVLSIQRYYDFGSSENVSSISGSQATCR